MNNPSMGKNNGKKIILKSPMTWVTVKIFCEPSYLKVSPTKHILIAARSDKTSPFVDKLISGEMSVSGIYNARHYPIMVHFKKSFK